MKKKPSIVTKPSTAIACVAFAGLLAAGMFLAGCGQTPDQAGGLSNVTSTAQGTASDVPQTPGKQEETMSAKTDGSEQPIPEPVDDPFEARQKPPMQPIGGLQAEEPIAQEPICGLPTAPKTKIDITECESFTSIPFRVTDANGNSLETEVFPEYWGAVVYCTTGPHYAFSQKFQDPSKHPDQIADHSKLTVDFGKYVPNEVRVSRDTNTYDSAVNNQEDSGLTDVPCTASSDGTFSFTAEFENANTVYYVISAQWDASHHVDYAIAVRKS